MFLPLFRFGLFALIAVLCYLPASGQQSCSEIFVKSPAVNDYLADEDVFPLFQKAFEVRPELLGSLSELVLSQAHQHLINGNVSFKESKEWDAQTNQNYKILVIIPGSSNLGQFAEFILKNYGARVVFNPAKMLQFNAGAAVTFPSLLKDGKISNALFYLNFNHILKAASLRYSRDILILHETRHLDIFLQMTKREPSPFYGEAQVIKGVLPNDPAPDFAVYANYVSFSELKTYHTQIKQQITILRKAIRSNQPTSEQDMLLNKLFHSMDTLNIVSARISYFLDLLREINHTSFEVVLEAFDIATVKVTYETRDTEILLTFPLVGAKNSQDPLLRELFNDQASWLYETTHVANRQSHQAQQLLKEVKKTSETDRRVELLDQMQKTLGTTTIIPPRPNR